MKSIFNNEPKLINFTRNLADRLTADPAAFGETAERVAQYVVTRDRFISAYDVANAEPTRTRSNIELKDERKKTLVNSTRSIIRQVQSRPETTDAQRRALQITVADRTKSDNPPPSEMPQIEIVMAIRHTVRLRLRNPDGGRRRPAGCAGAQVFYAVGAMPGKPGDWMSAGLWTSREYDVMFPLDTPAGSPVWVSAAYYNRKGQYGPMADAVTCNLPGGQVSRMAA